MTAAAEKVRALESEVAARDARISPLREQIDAATAERKTLSRAADNGDKAASEKRQALDLSIKGWTDQISAIEEAQEEAQDELEKANAAHRLETLKLAEEAVKPLAAEVLDNTARLESLAAELGALYTETITEAVPRYAAASHTLAMLAAPDKRREIGSQHTVDADTTFAMITSTLLYRLAFHGIPVPLHSKSTEMPAGCESAARAVIEAVNRELRPRIDARLAEYGQKANG